MPELLTKHPDVAMEVMESAGAECGPGQEQQILTECPPEQFCRFPEGELCVYGLEQADQMTQITPEELVEHAGTGSAETGGATTGCSSVVGAPAGGSAAITAALFGAILWRRCSST